MTYREEGPNGKMRTIELIDNGSEVEVTEKNKHLYVSKLCQYRMTKSIADQLKAFLAGFYQIIPSHLIKIFNYRELELLIVGLPEVDGIFLISSLVEDLRANTIYNRCSKEDKFVKHLFEVLEEFD
jgi:hypothetical protein